MYMLCGIGGAGRKNGQKERTDLDWFVEILATFLAVVVVLTLHEFAHAFVAYKCGDPTAKWAGRMTLNPVKHFDSVGLVCFVFVGFGWAKPVPVNEANFRKYRSGCFWTSAAGVITNYLSAFLFYPLFILALRFYLGADTLTYGHEFLYYLTEYLYMYSLSFCVFNLLPFYPLDGFRIVEAASKKHGAVYRFLRDYGYKILIGLIAESWLCDMLLRLTGAPIFAYINLLDYIMSFATGIFAYPITWLWNTVFKI